MELKTLCLGRSRLKFVTSTESVFLGTLSFGTKSCFSSFIFWFRGFSFALDSVFLLRIYDGNLFIVIKLYILRSIIEKSPGGRNSSNIMGLNMHTIQKFFVRRTVS
jgi:hypothetical protein